VELDRRGSADDVRRRLEATGEPTPPAGGARGPGRPKLGVVAREVTLLPRHWEWLGAQPGGASVALRRLVEDARRGSADADRVRRAREAAYRFMSAMAGNEPGFEEATRALFAGDAERYEATTAAWPADVRAHARRLAAASFAAKRISVSAAARARTRSAAARAAARGGRPAPRGGSASGAARRAPT
jgi:hypothetical protein